MTRTDEVRADRSGPHVCYDKGMTINHTGHGHPATPAARAACRKFFAANGMDAVTARVAQREQELDDAFGNPEIGAKNKAIGAEMAARKLPRKNNAQDKGIRSVRMTDDLPVELTPVRGRRGRIIVPKPPTPRRKATGSCVQAALHTTGRCACGWSDGTV